MEALINEKNEALRRLESYVTPRIEGIIGCSVQERIECEEESRVLTARIAEIDAQLEGVEVVEEVRELPENEQPAEQILAVINGIPLENYTAYPILIRSEVEAILGVEREIAKEAHDETKRLLKIEQGLVRDLLERNGRIENDYQNVVESENKLQIDLSEANLRAVDFESKHKAATNRITELEDELREALAVVNRNKEFKALTEAERTAEAEAERQKFLDSRVKIYNPRDADEIDKRECIANLADTGEEVRYKRIYEASYTIITEEEALAIQAMNKPIEMPEVDEAELFQEDPSAESSLPTDEQTDSGDNGQTVSEDAKEGGSNEGSTPTVEYVTKAEHKEVVDHINTMIAVLCKRTGGLITSEEVYGEAS